MGRQFSARRTMGLVRLVLRGILVATAVPAFAGAMEFSFDSPAVNSVEQFASGKISLQFRAEAFNVLNHTNFNTFASTRFGSSLFRKINSARDPRIMQLALKLIF
jgi:hypothetical protein